MLPILHDQDMDGRRRRNERGRGRGAYLRHGDVVTLEDLLGGHAVCISVY